MKKVVVVAQGSFAEALREYALAEPVFFGAVRPTDAPELKVGSNRRDRRAAEAARRRAERDR